MSAYGRPGRQSPSPTRIFVQRLLRPRPKIAPRLYSRTPRHDGTARRHGTTAENPKYAALGLSAARLRFRLWIRVRRGSMALGSIHPGSLTGRVRSPCTPCLGSIRLLSAPVNDPGLGKKAPARAFCCTYRHLCYGLLCLHAPFCCALRRLFKFLLYLQALFCCALRRLFAVPAGAFGHGSAALAFTHKNENKHGRSTAPPNPPDLGGPPVDGPHPGPFR